MISQSKTVFTKKRFGTRIFEVRMWFCSCDYCGATATKGGDEPGEADVAARKEGYTTVSTGQVGRYPLKWACIACKASGKTKTNGKKISAPKMGALKV